MLGEYVTDTFDPNNAEYNEKYYGVPQKKKVAQIREQSRKLTKKRTEVDQEITKRTGGAADANVDLTARDVESHEVIN